MLWFEKDFQEELNSPEFSNKRYCVKRVFDELVCHYSKSAREFRLLIRVQIEFLTGRFAIFLEAEDLLSEICSLCPCMVVHVEQADRYHDDFFEASDVSERLEDTHVSSLVGLRYAARRELDDAVWLAAFFGSFWKSHVTSVESLAAYLDT